MNFANFVNQDQPINPDDAPNGCIAVATTSKFCKVSCMGCCFEPDSSQCANPEARCMGYEREDGRSVVFQKKEEKP